MFEKFGLRASSVAALCVLALSSTAASAQAPAQPSKDWGELVKAAHKEGRVVFYAIDLPDRTEAMAAAFRAKFPSIQLVVQRGNSAELNTRIAAEERANAATADVFASVEPSVMARWSREGRIHRIESPNYLALKNSVFVKYPTLAPGNDRVVYSGLAYAIAWNTGRIKKPVTGYRDLVERTAEFGNGLIAAPGWIGQAAGQFYAKIEEGTSGIDLTKNPEGGAWLKKFGALKPKLYNSGSPIAQAVASGEVAGAVYAPVPSLLPLKAKGAPIDFVVDREVPTAVTFMLVSLKRGTNPNAGQLLIGFLLSEEGQAAAATGQSLVVRDNVPGASGGANLLSVPRAELDEPVFLDAYRKVWQKAMGQ